MSERYDVIVIGAGSAARDGAKKAATQYGASVALVERDRWGGSCPNVACKPTKAYLVAADLVHDVNRLAAKLGIEVGPARVDLARVKVRKNQLTTDQETWVENLRGAGYETVRGEATFAGPATIRVSDRELTAPRILIATGSRTAVPPIQGIGEVAWIDHVSALDLTRLPVSLLVVGAGPVGLEFAQIFARFGSRVTIVGSAPRIAPRSDAQASDELAAALEDDGIELVLGERLERVESTSEGVAARVGSRLVEVEQLLLASGRVANVEELALESAGVETSRGAIVVDDRMRTSAEGVWAAGDVTGTWQFTPLAQQEARVAVDDMFGQSTRIDYSLVPTAIFTDPELAGIGLTEEEARAEGLAVDTVVHPVSALQRASYTDTRHGLFKLVFESASRRVVGVHVVSRGASDVVQGLALGLKYGATVDDFASVHHAFPTFGEGLKAAAEQAPSLVPGAAPR